jgi:hypothetical protein
MSLERELLCVGVDAFPEPPDLVRLVTARLEREPSPARRARRRGVAALVAATVLVALVSAVLAVPEARSRVLHWFGIGGVRVQLVDKLPPVAEKKPLSIGVPVSLAEARSRVGFRILVPGGDVGSPDAVYVGHFMVDEVTLLYGSPDRVRLLLTEAAGRLNMAFADKFVQGSAQLVRLRIGGKPAVWIAGAPHEFVFVTPTGAIASAPLRLDKNTLLWQRGHLFLRLEGDLRLEQALRIARTLR